MSIVFPLLSSTLFVLLVFSFHFFCFYDFYPLISMVFIDGFQHFLYVCRPSLSGVSRFPFLSSIVFFYCFHRHMNIVGA